jgi:hypothetical protein
VVDVRHDTEVANVLELQDGSREFSCGEAAGANHEI